MASHARGLLVLALVAVARAGFTMDETWAIHPDGTPVAPEKMREAMRNNQSPDGEPLPQKWSVDVHLQKMLHAESAESLEKFSEYMQILHHEKMFDEDGYAHDVKAWRQAVMDDEWYADLLKRAVPELYDAIASGTDMDVQALLHEAHVQQMRHQLRNRPGTLNPDL